MKVKQLMFVTALLLAGLPVSAASAAIVCNADGDCWRVKEKYDYKPEFGLRVYSDDWKWKESEKDKYRWRESGNGRGYWRDGVWIEF
jgi:hypothetical protein